MQPLADETRWHELSTRRGPGSEWVRDTLRALADGSATAGAFGELWPELCSEGITYDAAYAAAGDIVDLARNLPADASLDHLVVLGLFATYERNVPADLEPGYRRALADAQALALARLADCPVGPYLRYLLAAVAAFRGRADLATALQDLDAIQDDCPTCGTVVFPAELQRIIARERAT